jgi:hypothetical protein
MSRFVIEVYKGATIKRGFLCNTTKDIVDFLSSFTIDKTDIAKTIQILYKQEADKNPFPNVIFFLDDESKIIAIDDFIKRWKDKEMK